MLRDFARTQELRRKKEEVLKTLTPDSVSFRWLCNFCGWSTSVSYRALAERGQNPCCSNCASDDMVLEG